MRKFVAGLLIRAAHRIYRPKVTEFRAAGTFASGGQTKQMGPRPTISTGSGSGTGWRPDMAVYVAGPMGPAMRQYHAREQNRGW